MYRFDMPSEISWLTDVALAARLNRTTVTQLSDTITCSLWRCLFLFGCKPFHFYLACYIATVIHKILNTPFLNPDECINHHFTFFLTTLVNATAQCPLPSCQQNSASPGKFLCSLIEMWSFPVSWVGSRPCNKPCKPPKVTKKTKRNMGRDYWMKILLLNVSKQTKHTL